MKRPDPPTADIVINVPGRDRHWVAEALIDFIRQQEDAARGQGKRRAGYHLNGLADRLRAIYDQVVSVDGA